MVQHNNFINGEWVAGASYTPNINPSNLSDVIGEYAQADVAQVETAVAAAKAAFPAWSTGGVQARSDALDKIGNEILARREELGTLLSRERRRRVLELAVAHGFHVLEDEPYARIHFDEPPPPMAESQCIIVADVVETQ